MPRRGARLHLPCLFPCTGDVPAHACHLRLLAAKQRALALPFPRTSVRIGGVVAGVPRKRAGRRIDGKNRRGDLVEKRTVVRDQEHATGKAQEHLRQPVQRRGVEVVRGLVQEQEVRPVREQRGEGQLLLLASAELVHGHGRIQIFQVPVRQRGRPVGSLRRGQPFQRGAVGGLRPRVVRRSRQTFRGSGQPLLQGHVRIEELGHRRGDARNVVALLEIPDGQVRRVPGHAPGPRRQATREALHERGLAGAVRAKDGDSFPGADGKRDVGEQVAMAATDREVRYGKHGGVLPK